MPNLFGLDIAKIVSDAFKGQLVAGTLTKRVATTRTTGSLSAGTRPVETSYAFEGFIERKTETAIDGTLASSVGDTVTMIGGSIAGGVVPEKGDRIEIEGLAYIVTEIVNRDPAGATYECGVEGGEVIVVVLATLTDEAGDILTDDEGLEILDG